MFPPAMKQKHGDKEKMNRESWVRHFKIKSFPINSFHHISRADYISPKVVTRYKTGENELNENRVFLEHWFS